jgi:cephalosporin-C deacetylase
LLILIFDQKRAMSIPIEHPFNFDPTYGYSLDELRAVKPPSAPPHFDDVWRTRYADARDVAPGPRLSASASSHPRWEVHDITYTSTAAVQIGGWLLAPREGNIRRGLVVGHGYGGRDQPDFDVPVKETAVLFPCFRGISRSCNTSIPSDPAWHVLYDIDKPDRYILRGCVEDLWLAVSVLAKLYPDIDGRIGYSGESFGGGVGALAMAFDKRIDRGHLVVPTFGDMPLWLSLPTTGSGAAVQRYQAAHPDVRETLRFFDAATGGPPPDSIRWWRPPASSRSPTR